MMDDATIQRKLNQIAKLSIELDEEAKRRWPEGWLLAEADGGLHLMSGDGRENGSASDRQKFIEFSSRGIHRLGVGAW